MPEQDLADVCPSVCRVVVDVSLDRDFDYRVPETMRSQLRAGYQVRVPFGRRSALGFVIGFREKSSFSELKEILEVIGDKPLVKPQILELAQWMARYYAAPLENALKTILPGVVRNPEKGFRKQLCVVPTDKSASESEVARLRKRAPKQAVALDMLLAGSEMLLADLARVAGVSHATIRGLESKGFVRITEEAVTRDPLAGHNFLRTKPLSLSSEQQGALDAICAGIDSGVSRVVLLNGVTGSGKTEVYLQAISYALDRGKTAIVLVPEISLTPQTVERFRGRFGPDIAVLHSHLSDGERHDEWHRIRDGKANIVVGARSALFAPLDELGLIVVDEEHEGTYKQEESPRYHARDMAVMRGRIEGASVVLGSATPSVETVNNVLSGKYHEARLHARADSRTMPSMKIVDMRNERFEGKPVLFSNVLAEAMRLRLTRGEQVILFLNRRGYSSSLTCPTCGHVPECPECSVALTYHQSLRSLRCHLCGYVQAASERCPDPDCSEENWKHKGTGTEKIEERIRKLFPHAGVRRMDSDTMTSKTAYTDALGAFRKGEVDILIGTQMIAKGLHFPNVTLVGVLNADGTLHMPDFRAAERSFQLLTQVAGRAGRGDVAGEVIVQTYTPTHPAIQAARKMDFQRFIDEEIEFRRETFYPPFSHMICVTLRGKDLAQVEQWAERIFVELEAQVDDERVRVAPPAASPVAKIKHVYRVQILARAAKVSQFTRPMHHVLSHVKVPAAVQVVVDVDAVSLM